MTIPYKSHSKIQKEKNVNEKHGNDKCIPCAVVVTTRYRNDQPKDPCAEQGIDTMTMTTTTANAVALTHLTKRIHRLLDIGEIHGALGHSDFDGIIDDPFHTHEDLHDKSHLWSSFLEKTLASY
jgi:hypothetical protein